MNIDFWHVAMSVPDCQAGPRLLEHFSPFWLLLDLSAHAPCG